MDIQPAQVVPFSIVSSRGLGHGICLGFVLRILARKGTALATASFVWVIIKFKIKK